MDPRLAFSILPPPWCRRFSTTDSSAATPLSTTKPRTTQGSNELPPESYAEGDLGQYGMGEWAGVKGQGVQKDVAGQEDGLKE